MKKLSTILASLLIMVLILGGCGSSGDTQAEEPVEEQATETHYTDIQTEIANLNNDQGIMINNGWIYSNGEQDGVLGFYKRRTDNSEITRLHSNVDATFITINGEYVYAVLRDYDTEHSGIYRYRLGGDDEKELISNAASLQIVGDSMYYCKCENDSSEYLQYCRSNLEGENEEIIIDKKVYMPCLIDNVLYYQDDADNETIHKYDLTTKEDIRITQEKTYTYFLDDDYIYCITNDNSTRDNDYKGTLVKVDLNSQESTTIYDGASVNGLNVKDNTLYFINGNDEERIYTIEKDGSNIGIITQDDYTMCPIIIDDMLYYANLDSDYYTEGFVICKLDGSNKLDL